ncbi:type VI secretion system protein ImpH [Granulicella aggregans]|uniref:Type VI secretion system protein ImpH n=1 Tax=Granulicella aggregans TaxID=474949 RepID=A0A7W8E6J2_9BACT|nr:type VI secretion system baseplate subunit TssG [Granulicella aggregans]MBB5060379.1 type VI secretion system protein ImpH [Granulicella aggregans]
MEAAPFRFQFFQMIRLLEKLYPGREAIGHATSPVAEVVRFQAPPTFYFPASELGSYVPPDGASPGTLEVNFFGLNTINGPMPRVSTEALLANARRNDTATQDFLDLFNHRLVSLFYRAWSRYRLTLAYEKTSQGHEPDMLRRLYDLVGLGTEGLRNRMAIPDESALFFSGLLSRQVRSSEGLRQILESYFHISVQIEQFTGTWVPLPPGQQTVLRGEDSMAECLGIGTVVGDEVWEQEGTMTIRLGPMPLARYREFLPGSHGQAELQSWLRFYSRRAFRFVVQLVLQHDEVPQTALAGGGLLGARLGYESWLKVKPMRRNPDETEYLVH